MAGAEQISWHTVYTKRSRVLFECLQGISGVYLLFSSIRWKYDATFLKPVHLDCIWNKYSTWHVSGQSRIDCDWFTLCLESAVFVCLVTYAAILFSPLVFTSLSLSGTCKSQQIAFASTKAISLSVYIPSRKSETVHTSNRGVGPCTVQPQGQMGPAEWCDGVCSCPLPGSEGWDRAAELLAAAAGELEPPHRIFHLHAKYGYVHLE